MSRFKISNLTPERAAQIRRGVVSGKILFQTITAEPTGISPTVLPVWLALKVRSYMSDTESYLEQEALMRTVSHRAKRIFTEEELSLFVHIYADLSY